MNLLIVDDEFSVRNRVKSLIDWNSLGIDKVEAVEGSAEALELCTRFQPDILLTDVRMPSKNGIELARELVRKNEKLKIIFLSGYSNREYLKNAISLGAISYVEKPIDTEELTGVIQEAVSIVKHDREIGDSLNEFKRTRCREHVRQLVFALSERSAIDSEIRNHLGEFVADLEGLSFVVSIVIKATPEIKTVGTNGIELDAADRIRAAFTDPATTALVADSQESIIVHLLGTRSATRLEIHSRLQQSCALAIETLRPMNRSVVVGVGALGRSVDDIYESCRTARLAAEQSFYLQRECICYYDASVGRDVYDCASFHVSDFRHSLKKETATAALSLVTGLTSNLKQYKGTNPEIVRKLFFAFAQVLVDEADRNEIKVFQTIGGIPDLWTHLRSLHFLSEVSTVLVRGIQDYFDQLRAEFTDNRVVNGIIRFVHKNYGDPHLCNTMIGDALGLSTTYLCHVFKEITGKTLNNFMTEYRIEKAKDIIANTTGRLKIKEIARMVGYRNGSYFSFVFKNHMNCSPGQYRDSLE